MPIYNAGLNPRGLMLVANATKSEGESALQSLKAKSNVFDDFNLNKYVLSDGQELFEKVKNVSCPDCGMVLFLALQDGQGNWIEGTPWTFDEMQTVISQFKANPAYEAEGDSEPTRRNKPQENARKFGGIVTDTGYWQPDPAGIAKEREDLDREFAREHPFQYRMREIGRKEHEREQAQARESMLKNCPQWVDDYVSELEQKSSQGKEFGSYTVDGVLMKEHSTEDRKIAIINVLARDAGLFYTGALPGKEAPGGVLGSLCGDVKQYFDEWTRRRNIPR